MNALDHYHLALNCAKRLRLMGEANAARRRRNEQDPEHPDYDPLPKPGA